MVPAERHCDKDVTLVAGLVAATDANIGVASVRVIHLSHDSNIHH